MSCLHKFILSLLLPVLAFGQANEILPEEKAAYRRADSLAQAGQSESAAHVQWALAEALQAKKQLKRAGVAFRLSGKTWEDAGLLDKSIPAYEKALALFREVRDTLEEAGTLHRLAGAYHQKYDYPGALANYLEARHLYQSKGNREGEGNLLSDLSMFYRDCDNMMSALETGHQALAIHEALQDTGSMWYNLFCLGIFNDETHHYNKALEFYDRALALSEESKTILLNNIANTHKNMKNYPEALKFARQSLAEAQKSEDTDAFPVIYSTLSETLLRLNHLEEALGFGTKCLQLAEQSGDLEMLKVARFNMSEILERRGDMREALRFFKDYVETRDSISNDETSREITRRLLQFEYDKKQQAAQLEQTRRELLAATELERQKTMRNAFIGGFVLMLALAGLIFRNFRREKQTKTIIEAEKQKSDELLLNILPATAAEELKTKGFSDARQYERATVLFSDFKDFTRISERVSPAELVKMIDLYFSEFDRIVARHGIEKIKTVGDAYVCANGLNHDGNDRPQAVVQAALDIVAFTEAKKAELAAAGKPFFECRIGINTGPVVAGVVGLKKFTYDIWGDTVNVAARMEQNGAPGKVNISEDTFQAVRDDFACEFRGKIEAKNKGEVSMYFVG